MKMVFMGTAAFAATILERLREEGHDVVLAVTRPDRAGNRGRIVFSPVKEYALGAGIPVEQPAAVNGNEDFYLSLAAAAPEVIVVAAYGRIIPERILRLPKFGCINVHASLLPRFRGASPIQHAILAGDEVTGVTVMQMSQGLDTGDIIAKTAVRTEGMHCPQLTGRLAEAGAELLIKTLPSIADGTAERTEQDDSLATYAGIIKKQDGAIDFSNDDAAFISRKLAAFDPWPGVFCRMDGETLKIKDGHETDASPEGVPGTIMEVGRRGLLVSCKDSTFLITELQMPAKKAMTVGAYLAGNRIEKGTVLE